MASRKDIRTGIVMEIPLKNKFGFGYVRLIFSEEINQNVDNNLIVKVYDKYSKESIKENFQISEFKNDNLLIYPLLLSSYPKLRGDNKWVKLGEIELTEEDKILPDFIQNWKFGEIDNLSLKIECTKTKRGCGLIRNFAGQITYTKDYESLKHMSHWFHYGSSAIEEIVTENLIYLKEAQIENEIREIWESNNQFIQIAKSKASKRNKDIRQLDFNERMKAKIVN